MKSEESIDKDCPIIPSWHIEIIKARLENYKLNSDNILDFDEAIDEIEKEL